MQEQKIARSTVKRIPAYLIYLKSLEHAPNAYISSAAIAQALGLGMVQVRKDLGMISGKGKPRVGYHLNGLIAEMEKILGYGIMKRAVIVGAGKLGKALLAYGEFERYGLTIAAAFDIHPPENQLPGEKPILGPDFMETFCREQKIRIGILTVPAEAAQQACDHMVACGIRAILNFAPIHLRVPPHILLQDENIAASLALLSAQMESMAGNPAVTMPP